MTPNERFNANDDEPSETGRLDLVSMADIEPERVRWLWPGRIPLAKLSVIAGIQGLGKSFFTLDMASRISNGTPWPDSRDDYNEAGNVILLSAEDALADTVRPRLDSAKANVDRIKAIQGVKLTDRSGQRSFDLQSDLLLLSEAVEDIGDVRLIVFDPIDSYFGSHVNSNRGEDVRAVLGPLADLAESSGAAVVAVKHLNKTPNPSALFRVCGSIAYTTIPRAVWLIAEDPGEPQCRLLLKLKFNLAKAEPNLAFSINHPGVVNWFDGYVDATADEVMGDRPKNDNETPSRVDDAVEFLTEALSNGQEKAKDIMKWAAENGIAKTTLNRAKTKMRIKPRKMWSGTAHAWVWALPEGTQDDTDENLGHVGHVGHLRGEGTQGTQDTHHGVIRELLDTFPDQPSSDRRTSVNGEVVGRTREGTTAPDPSEPRNQ